MPRGTVRRVRPRTPLGARRAVRQTAPRGRADRERVLRRRRRPLGEDGAQRVDLALGRIRRRNLDRPGHARTAGGRPAVQGQQPRDPRLVREAAAAGHLRNPQDADHGPHRTHRALRARAAVQAARRVRPRGAIAGEEPGRQAHDHARRLPAHDLPRDGQLHETLPDRARSDSRPVPGRAAPAGGARDATPDARGCVRRELPGPRAVRGHVPGIPRAVPLPAHRTPLADRAHARRPEGHPLFLRRML